MSKEVYYESDEAAKRVTVTGWVSRTGRFYGDDEHMARWDGCTHQKCACGEYCEKAYTACRTCRAKADNARYEAMPFVEWDGETPLCLYGDDTYFWEEDEVLEYCDEHDIEPVKLQLVVCEPQYPFVVEPDEYYCDILPEDRNLADSAPDLDAAFQDLNELIANYKKPISWTAGKNRTTVKTKEAV